MASLWELKHKAYETMVDCLKSYQGQSGKSADYPNDPLDQEAMGGSS
ncbi:hypothetical protein [Saccharococcus caldoxylosilyticus]|jgi:hypothetical protein|nr:hypothetical protein [Parageobacillus caldoxylosilyticus]